MSRKTKFRPVVTRVKLNPEQAVLACSCYTGAIAGNDVPKQIICTATDTRDVSARTERFQSGAEAIS